MTPRALSRLKNEDDYSGSLESDDGGGAKRRTGAVSRDYSELYQRLEAQEQSVDQMAQMLQELIALQRLQQESQAHLIARLEFESVEDPLLLDCLLLNKCTIV